MSVLIEPQQQQQNHEPLDYTSLQKELALTDRVWKKMCPAETDEDSSTTVVYRMGNMAERN